MRRTVIAVVAALLLATGCTGADTDKAADPKKPAAKTSTKAYDKHDCRALLERNYDADNTHDAGDEPECEALARGEYLDVVKAVLAGRKDEIMEDAEQHFTWDEAWKGTDADQRETVCDRLREDGAEVVGAEMAEESGDDEAEQVEMAEYLLAEKC